MYIYFFLNLYNHLIFLVNEDLKNDWLKAKEQFNIQIKE